MLEIAEFCGFITLRQSAQRAGSTTG